MENLEQRIAQIEDRNRRVEKDKAWERSGTRTLAICVITYLIAAVTLFAIGGDNIFLSALVPVFGFYLSIQSLPFIRSWWEKK